MARDLISPKGQQHLGRLLTARRPCAPSWGSAYDCPVTEPLSRRHPGPRLCRRTGDPEVRALGSGRQRSEHITSRGLRRTWCSPGGSWAQFLALGAPWVVKHTVNCLIACWGENRTALSRVAHAVPWPRPWEAPRLRAFWVGGSPLARTRDLQGRPGWPGTPAAARRQHVQGQGEGEAQLGIPAFPNHVPSRWKGTSRALPGSCALQEMAS